jgi:hypothetical protein
MPIAFPRKFARGQRVENADVYAELFIWPEGYFECTTHIRGRQPTSGACVNVRFALLDAAGKLLGTYGMPPGEEWCVGPHGAGVSSQRHDTLYGKIPTGKLADVESVALVFARKDAPIEAGALGAIASTGEELGFCPVPD